jgi:gamma-tubulin complex component 5
LHVDWDVLMKKIDDAMTLEAIRAAHDEFLQDATKRCLVSPDPTWTLVAEQIRTILAVACEYAACQAGDGAVSEEDAMRLSSAFEEAYGYIERVLQAKLDIGSASTRDVEDLLYAIKL